MHIASGTLDEMIESGLLLVKEMAEEAGNDDLIYLISIALFWRARQRTVVSGSFRSLPTGGSDPWSNVSRGVV